MADKSSEKQAFYVQAEDGRKFKMVIRGDLAKLQVDKIKRYLKGYGVPDGRDLMYNGHLLEDHQTGEDFGLVANATLKLASPNVVPAPPAHHDVGAPYGSGSSPQRRDHYGGSDPHEHPGIEPDYEGRLRQQQRQQQPAAAESRPDRYLDGVTTDPAAFERQLRQSRMTAGDHHPSGASSQFQHNNSDHHNPYSSNINDMSAPVDLSGRYGGIGQNGAQAPLQSKVTNLEKENEKLRKEVDQLQSDLQRKRQAAPPSDDMMFNAKANLLELSKDLGTHLAFDHNLTCTIGTDEKNTILVTFDAATERLYLYSTVLTSIPENERVRLKLFETLLSGAMLGREMAGGGIGGSMQNNILMMSTSFSLRNSDAFALRDITPSFVEALHRWRTVALEVCAGAF